MFVGNRLQRILAGNRNMDLVRLEPAVIGFFSISRRGPPDSDSGSGASVAGRGLKAVEDRELMRTGLQLDRYRSSRSSICAVARPGRAAPHPATGEKLFNQ